jgi:hypothetical protein
MSHCLCECLLLFCIVFVVRSEGILWHVLATPIKISQSLLTKYEEAVGDVFCPETKKGIAPGSEITTEAGSRPVFKMPAKDARKHGGL